MNPNYVEYRHSVEILAKRLILAWLEPDERMTSFYLALIREDCPHIDSGYFGLAASSARQAVAAYTSEQADRVRDQLLAELNELVPA